MNTNFQISDTKLTATWEQDTIWNQIWYCNNCGKSVRCETSRRLGDFCSCCGAKMTNPIFIKIEYDYD